MGMAIVFSFYYTAGEFTPLAAPYIYDAVGPFFWFCAAATASAGILALTTGNGRVRLSFLNIWMVLMFIYTGAAIGYGVHVVMRMRDLYTLLPDILDVLSHGGFLLLDKWGIKPSDKMTQKLSKGGSIFTLVESLGAASMLYVMPYPFDFLFFLGLRPDIAAVMYVVIPGTVALLSLPAVLAIRNYFASEEKGVIKHRARYEGTPLFAFMCGNGVIEDPDAPNDEEDLASTFDGSSIDPEESESLIEVGSASDSLGSSYRR